MTEELTKAARDALEAMERYQVKRQDFERFADEIATLRAAITLPAPQQATPKPMVPEMSSIAIRKLGGLQDRGWQINGYAIRRGNERGFVDASGFVGWWRSEIAPVVPEPLIVKGAMAGMVDAQVSDLWPTNGAALAAAQAKGDQP